MLKSAQDIYNLLKTQHIENFEGDVTLNLMGISVKLKDKSAIGYIFQEWLASWFTKNNIDFEVNSNSQEFPDFYLKPGKPDQSLLEVKTFDSDAGANFDVANFEAYCRSLIAKPYRLNADYLIFGYTFNDGRLVIKNIWLKKIWEITSPSKAYPIKTQNKQGMIYNIRPCVWESTKSKYRAFENKKEFVNALYKTLKSYNKTSATANKWLRQVRDNYSKFNHSDPL